MPGKVTAYLDFDTTEFRRGLTRVEASWRGVEKAMMVGGVAAAGALAGAIGSAGYGLKKMLESGIDLNSRLEQATATFTVFTKSADTARGIVADLKKEADITPFDTPEMIDAGKALISTAKGSREELMKYIKTAEILAALQPEQGFQGAAFALKEAAGGDYKSLIDRFNLSRTVVNQMKAQGGDALTVINKVLQSINAGPELITKLADTFEGRKSTAMSFFGELSRLASEPVFDVLSSSFQEFVDYMGGPGADEIKNTAKELGAELGAVARDVEAEIKKIDFKEIIKDTGILIDALSKIPSLYKNAQNNALDYVGKENTDFMHIKGKEAEERAKMIDKNYGTGAVKGNSVQDNVTRQKRAEALALHKQAQAWMNTPDYVTSGKAEENANRAAGAAAPTKNDVIQKWLTAHHFTRQQAFSDPSVQAALHAAFPLDATGGFFATETNDERAQANTALAAQQQTQAAQAQAQAVRTAQQQNAQMQALFASRRRQQAVNLNLHLYTNQTIKGPMLT